MVLCTEGGCLNCFSAFSVLSISLLSFSSFTTVAADSLAAGTLVFRIAVGETEQLLMDFVDSFEVQLESFSRVRAVDTSLSTLFEESLFSFDGFGKVLIELDGASFAGAAPLDRLAKFGLTWILGLRVAMFPVLVIQPVSNKKRDNDINTWTL